MKKTTSLIISILFFATSIAWAATEKDKPDVENEGGQTFIERTLKIDKNGKLIHEDKKELTEEEEWLHKGIDAFKAMNYEEAIKCFKKAIAINPNNEEIHYNLGIAYHDKGTLDEAITAFKKALALNPGYADAHYNLGITYDRKEMLDKAIVEFKEAIALESNSADTHHNLGYTYYKKGLNSMASDYLYQAALLHLEQGNKKWALKAYDDLKLTNSKELEQKLYEKLYPDRKLKKSQDSN
jgi:Flp pilus assembly protein TadD